MTSANPKVEAAAPEDEEDEDGLSSSATRFWPRSFVERGVSIPFTTPVLAQSRIRKRSAEEEAELLITGLSGAKGIYVIGWRSIREIFTRMTTHDQRLFIKLARRKNIAPEPIRRTSLKIAESGLAGPQAAAAAKQTLMEMENEKLLCNFHLVSNVLKRHSDDKKGVTLQEISSAKGRQRVKDRLSNIGARFGLSADEFYANLEQWSDAIAPVGLPDVPMKSRYRRTRDMMQAFSTDIRAWSQQDRSDSGPMAKLVANVADATLDAIDMEFEVTDKMAQDLEATMSHWKTNLVALQLSVERVSWLLDGWDQLIHMWTDHDKLPRHKQQDLAAEVCRVLPIIPEEEIKKTQRAKWRDMTGDLKSTVRALEDWMSGELDVEMVLRMEKMKAKSL
ncbi:MAG: hypothetical protein NXI16_14560 [Alphaproteobacteria bacterium]|nr:hypothetical protein [Alphaproteobacteria bacterium]